MNKIQLEILNILKTNPTLKERIESKEDVYKYVPKNSDSEEFEKYLATFIDLLYFLKEYRHEIYYINQYGKLMALHKPNFEIRFDNTKELLEQSEETLTQLRDFLIKEFNIKI